MEEKKVIEISTGTILRVFITLGLLSLALLLKDIILLVLLSFILATALVPLVERIEKRRIPRVFAVLLVYLLAGISIYLLFRAIVPTVISQVGTLSHNKNFYIDSINNLLNNSPDYIQTGIKTFVREFPGRLRDLSVSGFLNGALGIFSGFLGFLTVVVLTFYFLLDKGAIEKIITSYLPEFYHKRGLRVYKKISRNMSLWFRGQLLLSLILGVISYVGLSILGVDYALSLGVWAAFTELIPVIGPIIGGLPALLIAFTMSTTKGIYVLALYVAAQFIEGHFLVPQIMKKSLGLSPAIIIVSILVGARLFGVLGMLLALPVASAISVLVEEIHEYDKIEAEESKKS